MADINTDPTQRNLSGNYTQFKNQDLGSPNTSVGNFNDSATRSLIGNVSSMDPSNPSNQNSEQSIMDSYNAAKGAATATTAANRSLISDKATSNIEQQQQENTSSINGELESRRGFATNTALLTNLQNTATKRIRDLTRDMNTALLQNDAEGAQKLADLVVQEHQTIANARTAYVDAALKASTEARNAAGFRTPEQTTAIALAQKGGEADINYQNTLRTSVANLATSFPDAGILPSDDLGTATKKAQNSTIYKQNIRTGQATIQQTLAQAQAASASAGASSAQAAQTRALTAQYGTSADNDLITKAINDGRLLGNDPALNDPIARGTIIRSLQNDPQHDFITASNNAAGSKTAAEVANSGNALGIGTNAVVKGLGTAGNILFGSPVPTRQLANPYQTTVKPGTTGKTKSGVGFKVVK